MLQALIHNKISTWLTKSPWDIEDLLTSVVFGSCEYAELEGWRYGLRPFLSAAYAQNLTETVRLDTLLPYDTELESVAYSFWPRFDTFQVTHNDEDCLADAPSVNPIAVNAAIPEVMITLRTKDKRCLFLFVEVKLNIGKSSGPAGDSKTIGDQLGKYWCHLRTFASGRGEALGVVYVTPSIFYPRDEIEESRRELSQKLGESAPSIFWVSWREFVQQVEKHLPENSNLPRILKDTIGLLRDQWGFYYEEIKAWPISPELFDLARIGLVFRWSSHVIPSLQPSYYHMVDCFPQLRPNAPVRFRSEVVWPPEVACRSVWIFPE